MDNNQPNIGLINLLNNIMNHNVIIRTEYINIPINHPLQPNQNNSGCSEEFLNNLKEFKVDGEFLKKDLQCSICLDNFKLNDKCIILDCNEDKHIFHKGNENCSGIKTWLERNNTCPMCRTEFPKEDDIPEEEDNDIPDLENIFDINIPDNDNNDENDENPNINIPIINPNDLDNRITDIITNYINEIEENNEQRDIQMAIQASLNDS
tara:strand:+ start:779 stop:1402 length:624 start_codon:yes stop_codon:yes gene_type:complete